MQTNDTTFDPAALLASGSATLMEAHGRNAAMDCGIKPIDPGMRVAGPAYTVSLRPGDNLVVHHAVAKAPAGSVLVVDAKGFCEGGLWGDVLTVAAMARGIAGVIIDGAARDASSICELGFPVFCRALSIKGTLKNQPGQVEVVVQCGGMPVAPGDVVVGDRDGIAVIPANELERTVTAAQKRQAAEARMMAALKAGSTTVELLGLEASLAKFGLA